jgi:ABC-type uncharacterized transport system involved in gliding motility auxiliary subunit
MAVTESGGPPERSTARAIGTFMGVCGSVVFATSVLFSLAFPDASPWLTLGPIAMSLLAMAFWLAVSYKKLTERLSQRSGVFVLVTTGTSLSLITVITALHWLLAQNPITWDLTAQNVHTLSEQSQKVIAELSSPLRVTAFYERGDPELVKLKEVVESFSRKTELIELVQMSPTRNIEEAERYRVSEKGARVFVETGWDKGGREHKIARFSMDLRSLNHEEQLTNAIMKATQASKPKVYFLTGHREPSLEDSGPEGYKATVDDLLGEGYDVVPWSLLERPAVPPDAAAVLLTGPQQALLPPETRALQSYLLKGGRLGIFLEPGAPHGLESLLGSYGIQVNNDLVLDISPFGSLFGGGPDTAIAIDYADHPITDRFNNAATVFQRSRSLSINPGTSAEPLSLVRTGEKAWGETDLSGENESVAWNEGEVRGPVTLGVSAEVPLDENDPLKATRLLVFGDASFAANQYRSMGANRNLLLNAIGWLSAQENKIAVRPRTRGANKIVLTPAQREGIAFFVLYVLPVILLSFGLGLWLVRRQR